jgi:hypothetical protein
MSRKSLQWFGKQQKSRKSLVAKVRRIRGEPNEQFLTRRSHKKKKGSRIARGIQLPRPRAQMTGQKAAARRTPVT